MNAQVNAANIGTHNIRKYKDINCLIINETELRHEMRQREGDIQKIAATLKGLINANYITVTKGKSGVFLLNARRLPVICPGFATQVVDKIGSGDALLALLSVCLYNNFDENLSLFIGSLAAAQSVETIGNSKSVNKIFGPGNAYVTSAKKQVFGKVGIDLIAGPSEIVIVADKDKNAPILENIENNYTY